LRIKLSILDTILLKDVSFLQCLGAFVRRTLHLRDSLKRFFVSSLASDRLTLLGFRRALGRISFYIRTLNAIKSGAGKGPMIANGSHGGVGELADDLGGIHFA
jgi:hypothetical protein